MTDTLSLVAARRREIEAESERLSARLDALKAELSDLEATERVLGRLVTQGGNPTTLEAAPLDFGTAKKIQETVSTAKPPNTPTIARMIVEALKDAAAKGAPGLQPAGMTSYIAKRWWPEVPGVAISPIAWRMWKHGQLQKDGALYRLPKNTETGDLLGNRMGSPVSRSNPSALRPVEPAPRRGT
jgi:hypothetical protein